MLFCLMVGSTHSPHRLTDFKPNLVQNNVLYKGPRLLNPKLRFLSSSHFYRTKIKFSTKNRGLDPKIGPLLCIEYILYRILDHSATEVYLYSYDYFSRRQCYHQGD
uniref:Uncharacterized protein n=1 Tax=Cacopsylla melanoneura TaxID=428564 RepID=A0A8D9EVQ5_9HEMI